MGGKGEDENDDKGNDEVNADGRGNDDEDDGNEGMGKGLSLVGSRGCCPVVLKNSAFCFSLKGQTSCLSSLPGLKSTIP